ncbi:MAG TPA: hypothetical protein VG273_07070 [Bryobacteraceae bacterium]|jgi:hypothetical protein|nr:hypothetical protein [Bryobacteraceae bacterium]
MKVVVPHNSTREKAIAQVNKSADELFDMGSKSVVLADQKRTWTGPRMDFSLVAKVGFISLPLSGNVLVDDVNVTIDVELPAMAKSFIGEDKIKASVEQKVRGLLSSGA